MVSTSTNVTRAARRGNILSATLEVIVLARCTMFLAGVNCLSPLDPNRPQPRALTSVALIAIIDVARAAMHNSFFISSP